MGLRITAEHAVSLMPKILDGNAVESALDTIYAEIKDAASHGRSSLSLIVPLLSHDDDFSLADAEGQREAVCELFARCDRVRDDLEGAGFGVEIAPNMVGRWGCSLHVVWVDHCAEGSVYMWKAVNDE